MTGLWVPACVWTSPTGPTGTAGTVFVTGIGTGTAGGSGCAAVMRGAGDRVGGTDTFAGAAVTVGLGTVDCTGAAGVTAWPGVCWIIPSCAMPEGECRLN